MTACHRNCAPKNFAGEAAARATKISAAKFEGAMRRYSLPAALFGGIRPLRPAFPAHRARAEISLVHLMSISGSFGCPFPPYPQKKWTRTAAAFAAWRLRGRPRPFLSPTSPPQPDRGNFGGSLSSPAARSRRYRQRNRNGNLLVHLEIDEVGLLELLKDHGVLSRDNADNRDAIDAALKELIERLIAANAAQHNV